MVALASRTSLQRKNRKNAVDKHVEVRLEEELMCLAKLMDWGHHLKVKRLSGGSKDREGEVKGDTVYIYSNSVDEALKTLHHEFLDGLISEAISPYKDMVNLQRTVLNAVFKHLEEKAYQQKEKAIAKFERLLKAQQNNQP